MRMRYIKIGIAILLLLALLITSALAYLRPQGMSLLSLAATYSASRDYAWQCASPLKTKHVNGDSHIVWTKWQCSGVYPWGLSLKTRQPTGPLVINILDVNLTDRDTLIKPAISDANSPKPYLSNISTLAKRQSNSIAGINGGYFRPKLDRRDNNCLARPKSASTSQASNIGDGLLVIDKQVYSTNCANPLFSEPGRSTLIQDATSKQWRIEQVGPNIVPPNTLNALGAGPGLIQTINGKPKIRVTWEGIMSTYEFSANTAVILAKDSHGNAHMLLFTVDGVDRKWGMTSLEMANFIYNQIPKLLPLQIVSAMSMDQGNSTAMFVRDAENPIVTIAGKNQGKREIYDGLFIVSA